MNLQSKRILVTGGTGFLGWHVCAALEAKGAQVTAAGLLDGNLCLSEGATRLFDSSQPEVVIHLAAACGGIGVNQRRPADFLNANSLMGLEVLSQCTIRKVGKLLCVGSVCAYPEKAWPPFKESDLWNGYPEPTNAPYGIAKRLLLEGCQAYRKQYGLNAVYVLPANLYGPGDHFDLDTSHVIPALIRKVVEAQEKGEQVVQCWGRGAATRDFLHVADAARGIIAALEKHDGPEPINLGTQVETSIRDTACMIREACGWQGEFLFDATMPDGQLRRCVDRTRAREWLGWVPMVGLGHGIRETVAWYKEHRACVTPSPLPV